MKKKLTAGLLLLLWLTSISAPQSICAASSDGEVGIITEFDKSEYLPGEVATLTISITDVEDEAVANVKLSDFETHISFDKENMKYESGDFSQNLKPLLGDTKDLMLGSGSDDNLILIYFDVLDGVALDGLIQDKKLRIAELKFTVTASAGVKISCGVEEKVINNDARDFVTVVMKLVDDSEHPIDMTCNIGDRAVADIVSAVIRPGEASADNSGTVTAPVTVKKTADLGAAILIVSLHNKQTGLLMAPIAVRSINAEEVDMNISDISFNVSAADNSEIRYFLWNNFIGMKAVAPMRTAEVKIGD